jgi:hypothetical protein
MSESEAQRYTWRGKQYTARALALAVIEERAKLATPMQRIAFDNEWCGGLPLGLWKEFLS